MPLGELLALMHGADDSWRTFAGVVHEWRDQRLVRKAFMADASARGGVTVSTETRSAAEVNASAYKLWADRNRVRVERDPSHEARPELLVRDDGTWWSFKSGTGAVTNAGRENQGAGGDEAMCQLRPSQYLSRFRWSLEGERVIAGRPALVAGAERREAVDGRTSFLPPPFEMISGGRHFEVCVDADRGVILRVLKLVDGDAAELREFSEVAFDELLDEGLFDFVAPDASAVQDFDVYVARLLRRRQ